MTELQSRYCDELGCYRKVFAPHLYCDKHVDHASDPNTVPVCQTHNTQQRGKKTTRRCMNCTKPFTPRVADVKRGWGKFCSKSCKASWQSKTQGLHV